MTNPRSPIVNQKDSPATDTLRDSKDSLIQFITHSRSRPVRMAGWLKNNNSTRTALWICDFVMPALFFTSLAILLTTDHDGYIPGTKELLSNPASASSAGAIVIYSILGLSALISLVLLSISAMYFFNKSKVDTSYTKYELDLYEKIDHCFTIVSSLNKLATSLFENVNSKIPGGFRTRFVNLSLSVFPIVMDITQFCHSIRNYMKFSFKSNEDQKEFDSEFDQLDSAASDLSDSLRNLTQKGGTFQADVFVDCASDFEILENKLNNVLNLVKKFDISENIPLFIGQINGDSIASLPGDCLSKDDFLKIINPKMEEFNEKIKSFRSFSEKLYQKLYGKKVRFYAIAVVSFVNNSKSDTNYTEHEPDLYDKIDNCSTNADDLNSAAVSLTKNANSKIPDEFRTQLVDLSLSVSRVVTNITRFCHSIGNYVKFSFKSETDRKDAKEKFHLLSDTLFYFNQLNLFTRDSKGDAPLKTYFTSCARELELLKTNLDNVLNLVSRFDISGNIPPLVWPVESNSIASLPNKCLSKDDFLKIIDPEMKELNEKIKSVTLLCKTLPQESHGEEITAESPSAVITEGTSTSPDTQTPSRTS